MQPPDFLDQQELQEFRLRLKKPFNQRSSGQEVFTTIYTNKEKATILGKRPSYMKSNLQNKKKAATSGKRPSYMKNNLQNKKKIRLSESPNSNKPTMDTSGNRLSYILSTQEPTTESPESNQSSSLLQRAIGTPAENKNNDIITKVLKKRHLLFIFFLFLVLVCFALSFLFI